MRIKHLLMVCVAFTAVLLFTAYGITPEQAKSELKKMDIEYNQTAFLKCAREGNTQAIKLFLDAGMNPNSKDSTNKTALILATLSSNTSTISLLIQRGADVNARTNVGVSSLLYAVRRVDIDTIRILLANNAEVNIQDETGETPLITSILVGRSVSVRAVPTKEDHMKEELNKIEVLQLLLNKGADVNTKNNKGETALMKASMFYYPEIVKILLNKGAAINAKDNKGETALSYAIKRKIPEIVDLLKEAGAKE
jgi:uncharacterized protein